MVNDSVLASHGSHEEISVTKCHVEELKLLYAAVFQDAVYAYPALRDEFVKDQARLLRAVDQRGIHTFVVDLPALGKYLDQALASGTYKLSGLPLSKRFSGRVAIPKFLRGLYLLVFDDSGNLKEDYDVQAIAFLRQILYLAKKADLQCSVKAVSKEVRSFFEVDNLLPEPESFWSAETVTAQDIQVTYRGCAKSDRYLERVDSVLDADLRRQLLTFLANLDLVFGLVNATLGPYSYGEWRFRHGPGAVSNLASGSNKYVWTNWSSRLESVFPIADCGYHNYAAWADNVCRQRELGSEEPASKLVDVPKTFTKPRLIATEPSEHQWCQQNIWHYLGNRVKNSWLSLFVRFRDQTRNQELCKVGSTDGSLATVDLSAASDRVTCHIVGQGFRTNLNLLMALRATRTRFITCPSEGIDDRVTLRKFSTMGSACTFPIETLVFMCIALASVLTVRGKRPTARNIKELEGEVTIFGDDIIVPTGSRELLFSALEVLDFKVNAAKSFWAGRFRESCGVDSFAGVDVTPAYWSAPYDGTAESYAATVQVSNNFYKKFLVSSSSWLASTIGRDREVPVVPYDSGFLGLKSFVSPTSYSRFKRRHNSRLQRTEYLLPNAIAKVAKTPIEDDSCLLQYFTERPEPFSKWAGGVSKRPVLVVKYSWVSLDDLVPKPARVEHGTNTVLQGARRWFRYCRWAPE